MRRCRALVFAMFLVSLLHSPATAIHLWIDDGTPVCTNEEDQWYPTIVPDGAGGAIIVWEDYRSAEADIYAQRVDSAGTALWAADGVPVCVAEGPQWEPKITTDGSGGVIVIWDDNRFVNSGIYAQRIDASGASLWSEGGLPISTGEESKSYLQIIADGAGGAIIVWSDNRSGGTYDIYAQRITADGNPLWTANGAQVCVFAGSQYYPQLALDGAGGAIITWEDGRSMYDVYAQRIDVNGSLAWDPGGISLSVNSTEEYPQIVQDGSGGAIITWLDGRGATDDIYAQRLSGDGIALWTENGTAVCTAGGDQSDPYIVTDGAGGAIISWRDRRGSSYDIYAKRITADGTPLWAANGVGLCTESSSQADPRPMSDGAGGAIVTWRDWRNVGTSTDIYAQRIDASGVALWTADGVAITLAGMAQRDQQSATDGAGGAIITWLDYRSLSGTDIYAQRITASGDIAATLLESYATSVMKSSIEISWIVSEIDPDALFSVLRSDEDEQLYRELDPRPITRAGRSFAYIDRSCEPGRRYRYRIDFTANGERNILFETEAISVPLPSTILYQNNPNPFNPATTIGYELAHTGRITLEVFDATGRIVARLVDAVQTAGYHTAVWNGRNERDEPAAAGVYFYRLTHGKRMISKKMVLAR